MKATRILIFVLCCFLYRYATAQDTANRKLSADSVAPVKLKIDTARIHHHNPKIATRRSAIIPGWGQAYNREYWKIPIVWGALGTAAGIWVYNNTWYKRTKNAFEIVLDTQYARYGEIDARLFSKTTGQPFDAWYLQQLRNDFRRNRDISLLYFVGLWVLNIVDATVFAHLKEFDVSNDLSLRLKPALNTTNRTAGFSLSLHVKPPNSKPLLDVR